MCQKRFIARVLVAVGVVAPVTVAVALASTGEDSSPDAGPRPHARAMDGAFSDSPKSGEAVFRAAGLEPGDTTDGTVLVTNKGTSRGMFWLARTGFSDRQGPAGGTLSERLQVTVLDVTAPDTPLLVYTGGLEEMSARPLGFVAPGKSRIYSVAATLLPDLVSYVSAVGNPYEGSSTTISLAWGAIEGEPPTASSGAEPEPKAPKADETAPRLRLDIPAPPASARHRQPDGKGELPRRLPARRHRPPARGGAPRSAATTTRRGKAGKPAAVRITFGPAARQAMSEALTADRSVPVRFAVMARRRSRQRVRRHAQDLAAAGS